MLSKLFSLSVVFVSLATQTPSPEVTAENWQYRYESHFEADLCAGLRIKAFRKFSFMNTLLIGLMKQNPRVAAQVSHTVAGLVPYNEVLSSLRY